MYDQNTLSAAWGSAGKTQQQPAQQKKGPGGIAGFLVNNLPGIASGIGAVGGSFLAPVAGTAVGGAAGGAAGEFLKRKILGQKEDIGQIATQGIEGGVLSSVGAAGKGVTAGAKVLTKLGTGEAEKVAAGSVEKAAGGSFLNKFGKDVITQGQAAQGRVAGISAGSKVAGKELVPQDTERMLGTLKNEGIDTSNANNMTRDIVDKQNQYGKQIADHFKTNDAPLHPEDTKVIANNYLSNLKTTDPGVLKQAQILSDDLQKNVKSTKDLWEFRKTLDSKIPDTKQGTTLAISNKIEAVKNMRQYIADELGNVPGMKNYHDLAEIKPFATAEAKRLNNPSGGIVGRVLSSGPIQKVETTVGNGAETVGKKLAGVPVGKVAEKSALDDEVMSNVRAAGNRVVDRGDMVDIVSKDGSRTTLPREDFNNLGKNSTETSIPLSGSTPPPPPTAGIPEAELQAASSAAGTIPDTMSAAKPNIMQKLVGAAANPVANPGQTAGAVLKQEAGRGFGIPAAAANKQQGDTATTPDLSEPILQASSNSPAESSSPYAPENAEANVQAILQQGGTQKDVAAYLTNVKDYQALQNASGSTPAFGKPTAQQHALAQSAVGSLQQLANMIEKDPSILTKNATPGQGTPLVGSLVTNAAGAGGYHPLADNILSSLIHLQTGATATKEEITAAHGQLPQPGDSAAERQQKIQTLLSNFEPFLNGQ